MSFLRSRLWILLYLRWSLGLVRKSRVSPQEASRTVQIEKLRLRSELRSLLSRTWHPCPSKPVWIPVVELDPSQWVRVGSRPVKEEVVSAGPYTVSMPRTKVFSPVLGQYCSTRRRLSCGTVQRNVRLGSSTGGGGDRLGVCDRWTTPSRCPLRLGLIVPCLRSRLWKLRVWEQIVMLLIQEIPEFQVVSRILVQCGCWTFQCL